MRVAHEAPVEIETLYRAYNLPQGDIGLRRKPHLPGVVRMNMRRWIFTALVLVVLPLGAAGPLKSRFTFDEKSREALVIVEGLEISFTPGTAPAGNPICRGNN